MSVIRAIAVLIAVGLLATACGAADEGDSAAGRQDAASTQHGGGISAESTPTESVDETASPTADALPDHLDFTHDTVDGRTIKGADLAGKDAVLYFWAPWCPICRNEMPIVVDAAETYGSDVTFLGVASSGGLGEMTDFVSDTDSGSLPHLADEEGQVWAIYGVTYQHTYAFLDDDGSYEVVTGPLSADELARHIDTLVSN